MGSSDRLVSDILDETTRPETKQLFIAEMQKGFKLLVSKFKEYIITIKRKLRIKTISWSQLLTTEKVLTV